LRAARQSHKSHAARGAACFQVASCAVSPRRLAAGADGTAAGTMQESRSMIQERKLPKGIVRFVDELLGKVRRFYLVKFRREYVAKSISERKGQCRRCGACCSIAFRCPHLKERNHCAIYDKRYEQCGLFPIDDRDLKYLRDVCGFHFDAEESTDK